ncbi:hypothetical protein EBZ38_03335 [bacterium]|nr:hypothetical protein [bacterium]NDC93995.1 hypothetical protein [bacterium]NDD83300.1 hypothetical protein [bacterium]
MYSNFISLFSTAMYLGISCETIKYLYNAVKT